ncbi:SPARC-like [Acanthaster planci]|uniref:SPARC-like n=1 Tax=Acanthaster planci TaxID=133434 RepID=A0A8B7ZL10_ACAPL|nr:SPARC-like [Acanthaster planci]XP_022105732.1 SPARC-like [Acanthaster planci]
MGSAWFIALIASLCIFKVAVHAQDNADNRVTCPPLPAPVNGLVYTCTLNGQNVTTTGQQPVGSICELECDEGFALLGSTSRNCLEDGTWDGREGVCDVDPCLHHTCEKPRYAICISEEVDGKLKPICDCPESCPDGPVRPVCSVYGKQYDSLCQLRLYACKRRRSYPLAYKKPCIASQEPCGKEELKEFPHRLLEWFLHLREIDELQQLDPNSNIRKLDNTGREKVAKWKFDELDRKHDGLLDRRDLREFRYALMPLEHCADDFFQECYAGARTIDLERWNECLKVHDIEEAPRRMAEFFLNVVPKQSPAEDGAEEDEEA